jgi:hypothetical protein
LTALPLVLQGHWLFRRWPDVEPESVTHVTGIDPMAVASATGDDETYYEVPLSGAVLAAA